MEHFEHYEHYDPAISIQAELLKRHPDWIDAHAEGFREEFLPKHPEIVQEFEKDPEEAIKKIEQEFYH